MKSHVVHGLNCMNCSASYIGVTTQLLLARVQEHGDALRDVRYIQQLWNMQFKRATA